VSVRSKFKALFKEQKPPPFFICMYNKGDACAGEGGVKKKKGRGKRDTEVGEKKREPLLISEYLPGETNAVP